MKQDDFMRKFYQTDDRVIVNANELQKLIRDKHDLERRVLKLTEARDALRVAIDVEVANKPPKVDLDI